MAVSLVLTAGHPARTPQVRNFAAKSLIGRLGIDERSGWTRGTVQSIVQAAYTL